MRFFIDIVAMSVVLSAGALATVLLVPPAREKFFTTKLCPWPLPWDTTREELARLKDLSRPGDVIVESNLHAFQWIAVCLAATHTPWVHAALVDENRRLLTVVKETTEAEFDIYLEWGSTRLALIRPNYSSDVQIRDAIRFARSKVGCRYDPSFQDSTGNCNGLVASSLQHAGIEIPHKQVLGRRVYAPDCFFRIPGARMVWLSDTHRKLRRQTTS